MTDELEALRKENALMRKKLEGGQFVPQGYFNAINSLVDQAREAAESRPRAIESSFGDNPIKLKIGLEPAPEPMVNLVVTRLDDGKLVYGAELYDDAISRLAEGEHRLYLQAPRLEASPLGSEPVAMFYDNRVQLYEGAEIPAMAKLYLAPQPEPDGSVALPPAVVDKEGNPDLEALLSSLRSGVDRLDSICVVKGSGKRARARDFLYDIGWSLKMHMEDEDDQDEYDGPRKCPICRGSGKPPGN